MMIAHDPKNKDLPRNGQTVLIWDGYGWDVVTYKMRSFITHNIAEWMNKDDTPLPTPVLWFDLPEVP